MQFQSSHGPIPDAWYDNEVAWNPQPDAHYSKEFVEANKKRLAELKAGQAAARKPKS